MTVTIQPVLMSGGAGLRLWPLSRRARPKQFAPLAEERSLFQETALRVRAGDGLAFLPPLVIASAAHAGLVRDQLAAIGAPPARVVLEPAGRDTGAAAVVAALAAGAPDRLVLLLPCDHVIADTAAFHAALRTGAPIAQDGRIVTLGAAPTGPDTAYGYIKSGDALAAGVFAVSAFHEKPDRARAEAYLREGGYAWNAGIFLFRADALLAEFERHAPDMLASVRAALAAAAASGNETLLDEAAFAACRAQAFDRAIMEKTDRAAVVPVEMGWSDAGQWAAIHDLSPKDANGNAVSGDVTVVDAADCLARTDGPPVMLAGVSDLVVVVQDGVVLVTQKDGADSVKVLVETLRATGRDDLL